MAALTEEAATAISGRLSAIEGLYFPRAAPSDRKSALLLLLLNDPAIFLGTLPLLLSFNLSPFSL